MADFKEHNNRAKAKKLAEYITGDELRRYVAMKVHKYAGENVSVFDGAAGSGQLEQYAKMSDFTAVEIQAEACDALRGNYPTADVYNHSFFVHDEEHMSDCVIMNPPFSIKYKELSEEERTAVGFRYPWKKSGVVDDIFMLKGLEYSKRWGFFIAFPGVGYRSAELTFRKIIGNKIVELNKISNAFEDTPIEVIFLVVDKTKEGEKAHRELYDCNAKTIINSDEWVISADTWEPILAPQEEKESFDPIELEMTAQDAVKKTLRRGLLFSKTVAMFEHTEEQYNAFCREISDIALSNMI